MFKLNGKNFEKLKTNGSSESSKREQERAWVAKSKEKIEKKSIAHFSEQEVTVSKELRSRRGERKKETVLDISAISPEARKIAIQAEKYAKEAAEAEISGNHIRAEKLRATAMVMRRAIDEHLQMITQKELPPVHSEKKHPAEIPSRSKGTNLISGKKMQRMDEILAESQHRLEQKELRELKAPLALLAQAGKEAMHAAQAYADAKKSGNFLSRFFKSGQIEAKQKEAKRLRDRYKNAALKVGEILYFTKRKELTAAKNAGAIDTAEAKRELELYTNEEIKPLVAEEEIQLAEIDALLK